MAQGLLNCFTIYTDPGACADQTERGKGVFLKDGIRSLPEDMQTIPKKNNSALRVQLGVLEHEFTDYEEEKG